MPHWDNRFLNGTRLDRTAANSSCCVDRLNPRPNSALRVSLAGCRAGKVTDCFDRQLSTRTGRSNVLYCSVSGVDIGSQIPVQIVLMSADTATTSGDRLVRSIFPLCIAFQHGKIVAHASSTCNSARPTRYGKRIMELRRC